MFKQWQAHRFQSQRLSLSAPADMSLPQSLVNTGLSMTSSSCKYTTFFALTACRLWRGLPSELLGYTPNSRRKSIRLFEMLAVVWTCGKFIVPKMHVFRRQSRVIQCILMVIRLSLVGFLQKLVVKAMLVSVATISVVMCVPSG